jgi:hypothetical protein
VLFLPLPARNERQTRHEKENFFQSGKVGPKKPGVALSLNRFMHEAANG